MKMFRTAVAVAALAAIFDVAHAAHASGQFSCTGGMIESTRLAPVPKSGRLILSPNKISLDLGQGDLKPTLMSDNQIQLKFSTKEFVGEFFHYTNDLFLIYKSGHLARLTCTPA
jgi:hypothetical protein